MSFVVQIRPAGAGDHRRLGDLPEHRRPAVSRLVTGQPGRTGPLPPDSVIPVERTDPSFDVGTLLNGYEPLFSLLNPRDADNLTKGVVQSLQGDTGSITALVDQTSQLTDVVRRSRRGTRRRHHRFEHCGGRTWRGTTTTSTMSSPKPEACVSTFDARRPELVDSMGSMAKVVRQLSTISDEVYPSLNELVTREPGFASAHGRHRAPARVHRRQSAAAAQGIRSYHQRGPIRQRLRLRPKHPRASSPGSTT